MNNKEVAIAVLGNESADFGMGEQRWALDLICRNCGCRLGKHTRSGDCDECRRAGKQGFEPCANYRLPIRLRGVYNDSGR